MTRKRLRELGINVGRFKTGTYNAITDVKGVKVGHKTVIKDGESVARTGVTAIVPHDGNWFREKVFANSYVINGFGKTSGTIQVDELGVLESPIMLTNTLSVGDVLKGTISYMLDQTPEIGDTTGTVNVVVGECNDGYLNDIRAMHVTPEDAQEAIKNAKAGTVEEGCVGAGTGMLCLGHKGGIGTSSRIVTVGEEQYTVGALVLTNFGRKQDLRFSNKLMNEDTNIPDGSIMIILATDAPVSDRQLKRIAKRASFGLARTGSSASHGSGDIVLAFSTAHKIPHQYQATNNTVQYQFIKEDGPIISDLFEMTVDCVEEAIWNSMCKAETTKGRNERKMEAISYDYFLR